MNKTKLLSSLKSHGFSEKIITAFKKVKREDFVPEEYKKYSYDDNPLPIGQSQTISQPYTIAFMLDLLELKKDSNHKVLEIGSGSGYVLALLSEITKGKIFGVEIVKSLADKSKNTLENNKNITIINKSGFHGFPSRAPYDRILISAACPEIPTHLISQLKNNGIIVASVNWSIIKMVKRKDKIKTQEFPGFVFVPLVDD